MPPVSALSAALQQPPGQQSADAAHQKPEFSGFPCLGNDQANGSPDDNQFPEVSRASIAGSAPTAVLLRDGSIAVRPRLRCMCLHQSLSLRHWVSACMCACSWVHAQPGQCFLGSLWPTPGQSTYCTVARKGCVSLQSNRTMQSSNAQTTAWHVLSQAQQRSVCAFRHAFCSGQPGQHICRCSAGRGCCLVPQCVARNCHAPAACRLTMS